MNSKCKFFLIDYIKFNKKTKSLLIVALGLPVTPYLSFGSDELTTVNWISFFLHYV